MHAGLLEARSCCFLLPGIDESCEGLISVRARGYARSATNDESGGSTLAAALSIIQLPSSGFGLLAIVALAVSTPLVLSHPYQIHHPWDATCPIFRK